MTMKPGSGQLWNATCDFARTIKLVTLACPPGVAALKGMTVGAVIARKLLRSTVACNSHSMFRRRPTVQGQCHTGQPADVGLQRLASPPPPAFDVVA